MLVGVLGALGVICALILVLPTVPDSDHSLHTRIPSYLYVTTNAKIIAGYILGKVMFFFRFMERFLFFRSPNCGFYSTITIDYSSHVSASVIKKNPCR